MPKRGHYRRRIRRKDARLGNRKRAAQSLSNCLGEAIEAVTVWRGPQGRGPGYSRTRPARRHRRGANAQTNLYDARSASRLGGMVPPGSYPGRPSRRGDRAQGTAGIAARSHLRATRPSRFDRRSPFACCVCVLGLLPCERAALVRIAHRRPGCRPAGASTSRCVAAGFRWAGNRRTFRQVAACRQARHSS